MRLGSHLSVAGGLHKALELAGQYGFATVALFVRNQRQWAAAPLSAKAVEEFARARRRVKVSPVIAHGSYLINLPSAVAMVRRRSATAIADEIGRCSRLALEYYVFHPGSPGDDGRQAGIERLHAALNALVEDGVGAFAAPNSAGRVGTTILLEGTAGAGSQLGGSFEDLADILAGLRRPERFGVCLDTCHLFAAGYDIRTADGWDRTLARFDRLIGLDRLHCLHVNDAKSDLGSHLDRHEHIGMGRLGLGAFAAMVNDRRLRRLPLILETPKELHPSGRAWDEVNAQTLRDLVRPRPRK